MKSKWWLIAFGVCLLLAVLSPLASSSPDGLERVAADKGFIDAQQGSPFQVIAGYAFPWIHNEVVAKMVAGIVGTVLLFAVVYGLGWLILYIMRKRKT